MNSDRTRLGPPLAMEEPRPVFPDNMGFHIRMVQLHMFREFQRAFHGTGITPVSLTILTIIRDNPNVRQGALAEMLMGQPSNVAAMISRLEECGLVTRTVDRSDRRAVHMGLTPSGLQLLEDAQARGDALEAKLLGHLTITERETLRCFLDSILSANA